MKRNVLTTFLTAAGFIFYSSSSAQQNLVPDQNPDYAVSRDKYMLISDSINQWHSTTIHQTYKAYDWYEAKMERKNERLEFRRQLRLERARNNYYRPHHYNRYYNNYNYRYHRNPFGFWWW